VSLRNRKNSQILLVLRFLKNSNLTCIITGACSGIGRAIAKSLAGKGYHLVLISNSRVRLDETKEEIVGETDNRLISICRVDLSLQKEIRSFCIDFMNNYSKLDVLINNAGVNLPVRKITSEGFEYMFAVNQMAPFLMTNLLLDHLKKAETARIINIGSNAEKFAEFDLNNLQGEISFSGMKQYSLTKLCNLMFTREMARILKGSGISVSCLHPGGVRTEIMKYHHWASLPKIIWFFLLPFLQSPGKAAGYILDLINREASFVHGQYFFKGKMTTSSEISTDENLSRQLWRYCADIANLKQQ